MIPISVLDLAPVAEGQAPGDALRNAADLAVHAERLGYHRYWMAEHHSMPGIASAATAVALCHVGNATSTIRIGAGGVMLPNHSPLQVAEQFGTLDALFPGRVDLGLGRAPGTDQAAAMAMRRTLTADTFPADVQELAHYLGDPEPGQRVRAIPGEGSHVPLWILGSSLYGAQLAAHLGLPYAFASHFAPGQMMDALDVYRSTFRPSAALAKPYVMLGFNVFAADSDEEGELLSTSLQQAFLALRTGNPGRLQPPVEGFRDQLPLSFRATMDEIFRCSAIGSPETVRAQTLAFIERTGADELMVTSQIFSHEARRRSFEILSDSMEMRESHVAESAS